MVQGQCIMEAGMRRICAFHFFHVKTDPFCLLCVVLMATNWSTIYSESLIIGSPKFQGNLGRLSNGANYPISISNSGTKYCLRNAPIIKIEPINRCADYPAFTVCFKVNSFMFQITIVLAAHILNQPFSQTKTAQRIIIRAEYSNLLNFGIDFPQFGTDSYQ